MTMSLKDAAKLIAQSDPKASKDCEINDELESICVMARLLGLDRFELSGKVADMKRLEEMDSGDIDTLISQIEIGFDIVFDDMDRESMRELIYNWQSITNEWTRGFGAGFASALNKVLMGEFRETEGGRGLSPRL